MKVRENIRKNPEKYKERSRAYNSANKLAIRLKKYGLSETDYYEILQRQGGLCAICRRKTETLHIDHDHRTGRIRGLLCFHCNSGIGKFGDSIDTLESAIRYLVLSTN